MSWSSSGSPYHRVSPLHPPTRVSRLQLHSWLLLLFLDFQTLSKISQRSVDRASLTLEEVQQTDSVLVGNLHPSTGPEVLSSYFEGGGNQVVMEVTRLSESTAKVSFLHHGCKSGPTVLSLLTL